MTRAPELEARAAAATGSIFEPGRNCWRVERAHRFACLQDGAEYFRRVREAILAARKTIFVLGWDVAGSVDLLPGVEGASEPTQLAELLDFVARRRRGLQCYVLIWDYAALYALERDPLSRLRLGWRTHRRVHFRFDDQHPLGASHHQKVVVVDDRLAFSGGIDLTGHRWDTAGHELDDSCRINAVGKPYEPFHDIQAMVDGPAAASLGELARRRWRRCGRRRLPPLEPEGEGLWPADLEPDLCRIEVAIARTEPAFGRSPAVRECERLYYDSIAAARRTIYLENQYFTDARLASALADRLREPHGPEVIVVAPKECSGWLEQKTMGILRHEALATLIEADRHGRLRLLYPLASRSRDVCTFIHSKVMVSDDELLRIGSANLSNRSMGVDTECDLTVSANGDARLRAGIARVRDRFVAEHFGSSAGAIAEAVANTGSLRAAIDALATGERALVPIEIDAGPPPQTWAAVRAAADPEEPMAVSRVVDHLFPEIEESDAHAPSFAWFLPVGALGAAALAWWSSERLAHSFVSGTPGEVLTSVPITTSTVFFALAIFAAAGLLFVPHELLFLAAVVVFGPLRGIPIALVGAASSALVSYWAGRALGLARLTPWIRKRAYRLWRELRGRGVATVAVLRVVSVASSTSVNLLCGAARVPLRDFAFGTALGLAPGTIALCVLGALLRRTILHPSPLLAALTVGVALVFAGIALRVRRSLLMRQFTSAAQEQERRARFG